uniref:Poly [ADP-ribose] polymerase n=1 Tax=Acrobeloides nanus TaxID=290746 RepID=A0A914E036_9BILA
MPRRSDRLKRPAKSESKENDDPETQTRKKRLLEALKDVKPEQIHAEVDSECLEKVGKAHVYVENGDVYDVMLNQTNIEQNNNKFFAIQLIEDNDGQKYSVWFRWGRVGFKGQRNLINCGKDLLKAKDIFTKKFFDKTHNQFEERDKFEKVKGKYGMVQIDYSKRREENEDDQLGNDKIESRLDERVQHLLQLICSTKNMQSILESLNYNTQLSENPLGKITKAQVKAGFNALKRIENHILEKNFNSQYREAVNEFYTLIPHYFGMRVPPMIKTLEELQIEVAVSSMDQTAKTDKNVHPLDKIYEKLNCDVKPLLNDDPMYELITYYLKTNHGQTHDSYEMVVKNIYELDKAGEQDRFKKELGNRMLLWHGSRISNWFGILSHGLKIAPKEAPITGYMFGRGVYFADISKADYEGDKLPDGKHSVRGLGEIGPDPSEFKTSDDGCLVPCGKPIELKEHKEKGCSLNYNEYVVYDESQIRMRYLVELEFLFDF